MKSWIAISMSDFHNSEKKWQNGIDDCVKIQIVGAKNLEKAKIVSKIGNDDAWMVFSLNSTKNIAYRDL